MHYQVLNQALFIGRLTLLVSANTSAFFVCAMVRRQTRRKSEVTPPGFWSASSHSLEQLPKLLPDHEGYSGYVGFKLF